MSEKACGGDSGRKSSLEMCSNGVLLALESKKIGSAKFSVKEKEDWGYNFVKYKSSLALNTICFSFLSQLI